MKKKSAFVTRALLGYTIDVALSIIGGLIASAITG
jgi:hypothetical protein